MVIARLSTRNFEFTALGETVHQANDALVVAWVKHANQTRADTQYAIDAIEDGDVNYIHIQPGECARDNEVVR